MQPGSHLLHTLANKQKGDTLFVVPSASTSPLSLMSLARSLPSRTVCSFTYAGMEDDSEPHHEITEMAAVYVDELCKVQPNGPYRVAGYCFGGIVAQAMAAHLEMLGLPVERLVLIETFLPPIADGKVDNLDDQLQEAFQCVWQKSQQDYRQLPQSIAQRFAQLFQLHLQAAARYKIEPVKAEIQLIRTATHPDHIYRRWANLSLTKYSETIIPGNTFSILTHPGVKSLADAVEHALKHSS